MGSLEGLRRREVHVEQVEETLEGTQFVALILSVFFFAVTLAFAVALEG